MSKPDWYEVDEVPVKPSGTTAVMRRSLAIIEAVKAGKTIAVPVPEGMTSRGQKGSLRKASRALGVEVELLGDGDTIYVRLAKR